MLERIADLPPGIDGVQAVGRLSREDYERVLNPLVEEARASGRRLRLLYRFGPEFRGFTLRRAWEDARFGLRSLRQFDACAIVTDIAWLRESAKLLGYVVSCRVGVFANAEQDRALHWLRSSGSEAGVQLRWAEGGAVIIVEVESSLRRQDFDALARAVDPWIDRDGELRGLVIHVREFPGWEDVGSFLRHLQFVQAHHRKLRRVALATDSALAGLASRFAAQFVEAQIRRFRYAELQPAIAWADEICGAEEEGEEKTR